MGVPDNLKKHLGKIEAITLPNYLEKTTHGG